MKTKLFRSTIILFLVVLLMIMAIISLSVIYDENKDEQISLSLFPDTSSRPTYSDFVMVGNRLVSYKGSATTIRATDFPNNVETIGVNAFSTSKVEYVELPETVKTIEGYSFYACETLKNIVIPAGCTSVGSSAFNSCYGLENVVLQFDNPNVFSFVVFAFVSHDFNIYVPKDSYDSFYNSSKFSSVKNNIKTWNINLTIEDYTNGQSYNAEIAFGQTITLPSPSKEGYTFKGLQDSSKNTYETTFRWMSLEDCNLTATWEIEAYEVVYNGRDGKQYYLTKNGLTSTPTKITYGEQLGNNIIQTLYEDFRNEGEYLESIKINNISVNNGMRIWDLGENGGRFIIDLKFSPKHYNLRFDSTYDDITIANIDNLQYGDQVILPTIPAGTKTGYLFDYWYVTNTTFSGSRVVDFDIIPDCDPENNSAYINMWLEPRFAPKTYTVYLNANGGSCSLSKDTVTYDKYPNLPKATKNGYRFMGWEYQGSRVDDTYWKIDKNNITLTAMWEKLYTITLDANGGEFEGEKTINVIYGENIGTKLPTPKKDKHLFLYWTYNGQRIYSNTTWNVKSNGTVKAVWEELYRITLDAKGGNVSPAYIDLRKGEKIPTLPVATKEGYEFSGWYLNSIDFDPSSYNLTDDITLTTKWWKEVVLTDQETFTVTEDCTYVYLKGILSNLIKPMNIYIASNVENVKFTTNGRTVSCKSIIVNERTTPLTLEFSNYKVKGNAGEAAIDALKCPTLNIIARDSYSNLEGGLTTDFNPHGGIVCNNVNFYGKGISVQGGVIGGVDTGSGGVTDYYDAGAGIYAQGNISVYCEYLKVDAGIFLVPMLRNKNDINFSTKDASVGIKLVGSRNIFVDDNCTLEVQGGVGLYCGFSIVSYVGHGGSGIESTQASTITGYGTIIVRGGNGGSNDDPNYQNHKGGNGGAATINITIPSLSISATLENGLIGESTNYYDPDDYFN